MCVRECVRVRTRVLVAAVLVLPSDTCMGAKISVSYIATYTHISNRYVYTYSSVHTCVM